MTPTAEEQEVEERREEDYQESFRDHLGNVDREGRRAKIYPRRPRGRYHTARKLASFVLLAVLFAGPFVRFNGRPLLLLNLLERKFVLFGIPFWPQDFYLFLLAMLALVLFVVLFTAVFGRLWCGWACPQTVFMEMLFRKIEYLIEGDARRQRRLDQGDWTGEKIFKKAFKHGIFFAISFLIANIFLAYIIGAEELWKIISDPPREHLKGLSTLTLFSLVFYGVFARFREQVCVIVCPYGRWQSVMVNEDTIAVTYDYLRGEPRGKRRKGREQREAGDCVDCKLCEQVCPTSIDIRNGIQLECINCTACMDACDEVMDRIERPRGLIRYSSYRGIEEPVHKLLTPRIMGYSTVLVVLVGIVAYLFSTRAEVQAIILREPGRLYNELADGRLANFYSVKIINKTFDELPVEIRVEQPAGGSITFLGELGAVPPQEMVEGRFYLALSPQELRPGRNEVEFSVYANDRRIDAVESGFLAPQDVRKRGQADE